MFQCILTVFRALFKIIVFYEVQILLKDLNSCRRIPFYVWFADICSLFISVVQSCVWTVKHQLKQSSIWELQTPKWLQKNCLHLYQQRTECDDSFTSLFFLFGHILGEKQNPPSPHFFYAHMAFKACWGSGYFTKTQHYWTDRLYCIFIETTPLLEKI